MGDRGDIRKLCVIRGLLLLVSPAILFGSYLLVHLFQGDQTDFLTLAKQFMFNSYGVLLTSACLLAEGIAFHVFDQQEYSSKKTVRRGVVTPLVMSALGFLLGTYDLIHAFNSELMTELGSNIVILLHVGVVIAQVIICGFMEKARQDMRFARIR